MYSEYINMNKYEFMQFLKKTIFEILDDYKKHEETNFQSKKTNLVTIKEVIAKLKVSKPTIYNWIKKDYIKPNKIGGKTLFDLEEIIERIKRNSYQFGKDRDYNYKREVKSVM